MARSRSESSAPEIVDGRLLRSVRSRQAILDALVSLVREGKLRPTGQQVADRAGVGLRTVFRHFEDMETLFAELRERVERELRPELAMPRATGSFDERLATFVKARARAFERMAPFQRSERIHRWNSAVMQDAHATLLRNLHETLLASLPEVEQVSPATRQAIEAVTGFEFWDVLRSDQGLGVARAEDALREVLVSLLRDANA